MRAKRYWMWAPMAVAAMAQGQHFTQEEIAGVRALWKRPDAYRVHVPKSSLPANIWQARQTVAGSQWLWQLNRLRGLTKGQTSSPKDPPEWPTWDAWITEKYDYDYAAAQHSAARLNGMLAGGPRENPIAAVDPGPAPAKLIAFAGNPPAFAEAVVPLEHRIRFDDLELSYEDHVQMGRRTLYYRSDLGVRAFGSRVRDMKESELGACFEMAGVGPSERKVMAAVSMLEGGFESVNTYDTGFVSVGFIQFACLSEGGHSLGDVLMHMKVAEPRAFHDAFRRFGLDVSADGKLVALDLATGAELVGPAAAKQIIEDKRLIAVFQRAGRVSLPFKVSQIAVAKRSYYPASDVVPVQVGGVTWNLKVSDFIRSEAGMATLMDRKVNTGKLDPLPFILSVLIAENRLSEPAQLAAFERDIVVAMKFRKDYLVDKALSQPGPAKTPERNYGVSRKGTRTGRGGK